MILARHADALLWTGRYLERAETLSRSLSYAADSITGLRADEARAESEMLVNTLGLQEELQAVGPLDSRPQLVAFLLSDKENPGSLLSSIVAVRENLRLVRDRIPIELWEEANGLYLRFPFLGHENTPKDLHEVLLMVRRACLAISGVLNEGMRQDEGYSFVVIGRMIERSMFTVGLIAASYSDPRSSSDAARMLRLTSSVQAYHRQRSEAVNFSSVVHYLLHAEDLPRSLLSCLVRAETCLVKLASSAAALALPKRKISRLRSRVEFGELADGISTSPARALLEFALDLAEVAADIGESIAATTTRTTPRSQYLRPGAKER